MISPSFYSLYFIKSSIHTGEDLAYIGYYTVPGIMKGEATSLLNNGCVKAERFYIR